MKDLFFNHKILSWFRTNKRDLPWRDSGNAYFIWISEVILQQTRIDQGTAYYRRFISAFPTVDDLANADEEEVLNLWQGLGYYSRARNLHKGAMQVVKEFGGKLPENAAALKKIQGIGDYTSAAIASIAFGEPVAALDGNLYRVLSRYFGIDTPIDTSKGKKEFNKLANQLIDQEQPGDFNQALMDFGALQCKPAKPACSTCPINEKCYAYGNQMTDKLPLKSQKTKVRHRYFYYFICENNDRVFMKKRGKKDIWEGLYDFPLIESSKSTDIATMFNSKEFRTIIGDEVTEVNSISKEYIHKLSHQHLHVKFIRLTVKSANKMHPNFILTKKRNIFDLPVPRLIEKYLQENADIE